MDLWNVSVVFGLNHYFVHPTLSLVAMSRNARNNKEQKKQDAERVKQDAQREVADAKNRVLVDAAALRAAEATDKVVVPADILQLQTDIDNLAAEKAANLLPSTLIGQSANAA